MGAFPHLLFPDLLSSQCTFISIMSDTIKAKGGKMESLKPQETMIKMDNQELAFKKRSF